MLRPRVIPCLLIRSGGLVKTIKFSDPKYLGDPLNAVRIFNEKYVDELIVIDIDATVKQSEPNYPLIRAIASECCMPLCYCGGITTVDQIERIIGLGVEKIGLSSILTHNPRIIEQAAASVGSQSILAVIDVKKVPPFGFYQVFTHNATRNSRLDPLRLARLVESLGAGEILLNSIDRDGTMKGYDTDILQAIRDVVSLPITILGGAGTLDHIKSLFDRFGLVGAAAGSIFVFKGNYRAVLLQYPSPSEKESLYSIM